MPDATEEFLAGYSDEVAGIARALRKAIRSSVPDASEKLQLGWKCITFSRSSAFCSILAHAEWVNLQFQKGAELDDPQGVLEGTGKSMRHVKIKSEDDLSAELRELVLRASEHAA